MIETFVNWLMGFAVFTFVAMVAIALLFFWSIVLYAMWGGVLHVYRWLRHTHPD